jgi:hypothetical protein
MNRLVLGLLVASFLVAGAVGFSFYFSGPAPTYPSTTVSAPGSAPGQATGYTQTLECGPGFNHLSLNIINATYGVMACNP